MLSYLKITNYALIESSEIEFSGGFTVVTGESGAGKAIVMSAIELLCGGRGGKGSIRTGCDRCTLSGIFTVPPAQKEQMEAVLEAGGLDIPENFTEITLRRVITQSATRNFIDDTPVSSKLLSQIGAFLVDRHGANEQISLTVPARQLELLDNYADCAKEKAACAEICKQISELTHERAAFEAQLPSETEADRLQLMLEEIDRIDPELVRLFCERMQVSEAVAAYKKEHGLPVRDPEREHALLSKVENLAGDEMAAYVRTLYETILSLSRAYQEDLLQGSTPDENTDE